jgi:hypothetical protein
VKTPMRRQAAKLNFVRQVYSRDIIRTEVLMEWPAQVSAARIWRSCVFTHGVAHRTRDVHDFLVISMTEQTPPRDQHHAKKNDIGSRSQNKFMSAAVMRAAFHRNGEVMRPFERNIPCVGACIAKVYMMPANVTLEEAGRSNPARLAMLNTVGRNVRRKQVSQPPTPPAIHLSGLDATGLRSNVFLPALDEPDRCITTHARKRLQAD